MAETISSISSIKIQDTNYDIVDQSALHDGDVNQLSIAATNGVSAEITSDSINIGLDSEEIGETVITGGEGIQVVYDSTSNEVLIELTGSMGISDVGVDLKIDDEDRVAVNTDGTMANSAHMSFVAGSGTYASGIGAFADGVKSSAIGIGAKAAGYSALASGDYSYAAGTLCYTDNVVITQTVAIGPGAYAHGGGVSAIGIKGHAEGASTLALGKQAHAEGMGTSALAEDSHAEGNITKAIGTNSHAEGDSSSAIGQASHAEGNETIANGIYSHAEGCDTTAVGYCSHAEGFYTSAAGFGSHAGGYVTNQSYSIIANNPGSFAHGYNGNGTIIADGYGAVALGGSYNTINEALVASGNGVVALGIGTSAISNSDGACISLGKSNLASGSMAFAEGHQTRAIGYAAHAAGTACSALAKAAFAGGSDTIANASEAIAYGWVTSAFAQRSTVLGNHTKSTHNDNLIIGQANNNTTAAFVIGNGEFDMSTTPHSITGKDIFTVDWDGHISNQYGPRDRHYNWQYPDSAAGGGNTGWTKILSFKCNGTYCNEPIDIRISQRSQFTEHYVMRLSNSSTTTYTVLSLLCRSLDTTGNRLGYVISTVDSVSTIILYYYSAATYNRIHAVVSWSQGLENRLTITKHNDYPSTTPPTGLTQSKYSGQVASNMSFHLASLDVATSELLRNNDIYLAVNNNEELRMPLSAISGYTQNRSWTIISTGKTTTTRCSKLTISGGYSNGFYVYSPSGSKTTIAANGSYSVEFGHGLTGTLSNTHRGRILKLGYTPTYNDKPTFFIAYDG